MVHGWSTLESYRVVEIVLEDESTYLITKDICSWWLASGVQSSITEKYFAFFIYLIISDLIAEAIKCINSF